MDGLLHACVLLLDISHLTTGNGVSLVSHERYVANILHRAANLAFIIRAVCVVVFAG